MSLQKATAREFPTVLDINDRLIQAGILPLGNGTRENMDERMCCRAGTKILLADGTEKAIDSVEISTPSEPLKGDKILTIDGVLAYIIALSGGRQPENWQLVEIVARAIEGGTEHSLVATRTHAYATSQVNILQGHLLKPGHVVRSIYGESYITSVTPIDYTSEPVWNVYLASHKFATEILPLYSQNPGMFYSWLWTGYRGSLLDLTPRSHMLFENGFLAGDLAVQFQLEDLQRKGCDYNML